MDTPSVAPRRATLLWLCTALFLFALGLRLIGLDWGLPYTDHPDEPSATNRVLGMLRRDDWNPRFFGKPALYYYVQRVVVAAHVRQGIMTGRYTSLADLPQTTDQYMTAPGVFIWERALTALVGALTVPLTLLVARRWWGLDVGLVAAALVAVVPFHVRHSQYVTADVPTAFLALLTLGASLRLLADQRWRTYLLAGVCVGLTTAMKYNGAATAVFLLTAHLLAWRGAALRQGGRLVLAGAASLVIFALTNPYLVLNTAAFLDGVVKQYRDYSPQDRGDFRRTWPVAAYASFFLWDMLTLVPALAALLGTGVTLARRHAPGIVLLSCCLVYPLMFLPQSTHYYRNMLPLVPLLAILAGVGVSWLAQQLAALLRRPPAARLAALVLTVAIAAYPFSDALSLVRFYAQPHSKVRAATYIQTQLPKGLPIAVALHPVQWANVPFVTPLDDVAVHDAAWYRAAGYRYVVANTRDTNHAAYAQLRAAARVIAQIAGDEDGMPGPPLEVLDLGTTSADIAMTRQPADFGDELRLDGYQLGRGALRAAYAPVKSQPPRSGEPLQLNLFLNVVEPPREHLTLFIHVLDASGQRVAQRDTPVRPDTPPGTWRSGEVVAVLGDLPLPALPSGSYRVVIGLYDAESGARLPVGGSTDGALLLARFEVK